MDQIDQKILNLLKENSRLTNKEIGEKIHLTGQAVGNRINQMIDQQVIKNFTVEITYETTQFIRLFMNGTNFSAIEKTVTNFEKIERFYKVSGQACYVVIAHFKNEELNEFIEQISKWARYSVETIVKELST